jgi:hypothetical protein
MKPNRPVAACTLAVITFSALLYDDRKYDEPHTHNEASPEVQPSLSVPYFFSGAQSSQDFGYVTRTG